MGENFGFLVRFSTTADYCPVLNSTVFFYKSDYCPIVNILNKNLLPSLGSKLGSRQVGSKSDYCPIVDILNKNVLPSLGSKLGIHFF